MAQETADPSRPAADAGAFGLAKSYVPVDHEARVSHRWGAAACFHASPETDAPRFSMFIPPPNVTAALHLGHALNNTLQDILARQHRMRGFSTLWMPGTDHAGIATQAVVERRLQQQGKRRTDFTREQFIALVEQWKDEYEATILEQLRAMGCSCDFERTRFTMDPVCATAVREAFFRLFAAGLVYRGKRLVNWDPVSQTALADDEVEMEEVDGHFWYLRYPLEDGSGHVTVATTRPETMLGDTAVGVNPRDPRAAGLRGKRVRLPIVGRIIPIIEDEYVVMSAAMDPSLAGDQKAQFATGFLKVTPAHDPNDWELGRRHGLAVINVMDSDASISDRHGWTDVSTAARAFVGLSREAARGAVVEWFKSNGLLEGVRPYRHSVGHSYRSHVAVEPYLSDQWYVRVTDDRLAGAALRALDPGQRVAGAALPSKSGEQSAVGDGGLRFSPERYARTYQQWHEGIRDWCISRQLWWGHRIPVFRRVLVGNDPLQSQAASDGQLTAVHGEWSAKGAAEAVRRGDEGVEHYVCLPTGRDEEFTAALAAAGFVQDNDVLDTWFSSALWPLSTLGWPHPESWPGMRGLLDAYNPSAVLSTAREIITLWVSRMVMFNRYFRGGQLPFERVFIHSVVQDGFGQKMSKSLGNGVDPRDIIATHGADALRWVMAQMSTETQDVRLAVDMLCPWSGQTFTPQTITTPSGHQVAAPVQFSPANKSQRMVTAFGVASGQVQASAEQPLAKNTSARFDAGRNLVTKLWNATRFALSQCEASRDPELAEQVPTALADRWIISRLARTVAAVDGAMAEYRFNALAEALYDFFWRDLCDWYLEAVKPTIRQDPRQQQVLRTVLDGAVRLMHPVLPFVTEALWEPLSGAGVSGVAGLNMPPSPLAATAAWPAPAQSCIDHSAEETFARVQQLVDAIRNARSARQVEPRRKVELHASAGVLELIRTAGGIVEHLAGLASVHAVVGEAPPGSAAFTIGDQTVWLSGLVDAADAAGERHRLEKLISERERYAAAARAKLGNSGYVDKAPPAVVAQTRRMVEEADAAIASAKAALAHLAPCLALAWIALSGCTTPAAHNMTAEPGPAVAAATTPAARREPWQFGAVRGEVLHTESYRISTTLRDAALRDTLPDFMERSLAHYRTALVPLPAPDEPLESWVFGSRSEWAAYTTQRLGAEAANYLGIGRGGYTTEGAAVLFDIGPVDTLTIAAHEGWHQFTQSTFCDTLPDCLEEGIACYMEGHRMARDGSGPTFQPWRNLERFGELRSAARRERLLTLTDVLNTPPTEMIGRGRDALLTYYAQAWALVHYLAEGESGRWRAGLEQLLRDAADGQLRRRVGSRRSPERVIRAYISDDLPALARGYDEFVQRITARGSGDAVWAGRSPLKAAPVTPGATPAVAPATTP